MKRMIILVFLFCIMLSACSLIKSSSQKAAEQKAMECYKNMLDQHQNFSYRNYHTITVRDTAPLLSNEWRVIVRADYETLDMDTQCGQVVVLENNKTCKEKIQDVKC